jgi:Transposase Tn5 dimerisation domain/RuvB AAA lid domain
MVTIVPLANACVVLTARMGLLTAPLRSRFEFTCRLDYYPPEILKTIIQRTGRILNIDISEEAAMGIATRARGTPIEKKESFRWLKSYRVACEIARDTLGTQIINMTDREGDIIEIFSEFEEQKKQGVCADYIIRSHHDRIIEDESDGGKMIKNKMRNKLKKPPTLGEVEFSIPSTKNRKGRIVKQELKAVRMVLNSKKNFIGKLKVNAVMAIETNAPKGESPLVWIFVTSLPINTFGEICKVINYYLCRWEIELFFKVLKSGCKIEERQLQATCRMKALVAVFVVLSWRVMFTMMLGRICSEMPCNDLFADCEWKSVYKVLNKSKRLPRKPPLLGEFTEMIANLGGYIKRKNGEPPGVKVMWKGMARMVDFSIAWEAFAR